MAACPCQSHCVAATRTHPRRPGRGASRLERAGQGVVFLGDPTAGTEYSVLLVPSARYPAAWPEVPATTQPATGGRRGRQGWVVAALLHGTCELVCQAATGAGACSERELRVACWTTGKSSVCFLCCVASCVARSMVANGPSPIHGSKRQAFENGGGLNCASVSIADCGCGGRQNKLHLVDSIINVN